MCNEIVVGLDDSPSSQAALQWSAQQAKTTSARLRAVHALEGPYGVGLACPPRPVYPMEVTPITPRSLASQEFHDAYRNEITAILEAVSPPPDWILEFVSGYAGEAHTAVEGRTAAPCRKRAYRTRSSAGGVGEPRLSHAADPVVCGAGTPS
jgi:Universal stress protein family